MVATLLTFYVAFTKTFPRRKNKAYFKGVVFNASKQTGFINQKRIPSHVAPLA